MKLFPNVGVAIFVVGLVVFAFLPQGFAVKTEGVPAFGHVFVIIGENRLLSEISKISAPYIVGTIFPGGSVGSAWLTGYFAVTHYSESNYVAMTSGQYTKCQQKDGSVASCTQNVNNLFHQLDVAGISWQSWMESMPSPCYLLSAGGFPTQNKYAPKHNPALFYNDFVTGGTTPTSECTSNDIPAGSTGPNDMTAFNAALASGSVARFNLVVPNECQDGHTNCKPAGQPITQFDDFVAAEVPLIMASPAFGSDGVIIITFDEGHTTSPVEAAKEPFTGGDNVLFAVISPLVNQGVYGGVFQPACSCVMFDHYSFLRTMEDGFGITTYLGNATAVSPINTIWK